MMSISSLNNKVAIIETSQLIDVLCKSINWFLRVGNIGLEESTHEVRYIFKYLLNRKPLIMKLDQIIDIAKCNISRKLLHDLGD